MTTDITLALSDLAKNHLLTVLSSKKDALGIRIGVKKAGCSGYEYTLALAYESRTNEYCIPVPPRLSGEHFSLFVDQITYWKFLKGGTVMDYEQKGVQSAITFHNPNVAAHCGCGESFTLIDESI